jgi:hypothetical protein
MMAKKHVRPRRFTELYTALQALFLDERYCLAFIETADPEWIGFFIQDNVEVHNYVENELARTREQLAKATAEAAEKTIIQRWRSEIRIELKELRQKCRQLQQTFENDAVNFDSFKKSLRIQCNCASAFNVNDADVEITCQFTITPERYTGGRASWKGWPPASKTFRIHLEPTISDDYPALLKQMRATSVRYLFLDTYTARGATFEEFNAIFRSANLTVVRKADVDPKITASQARYARSLPYRPITDSNRPVANKLS